MLKQPPARKGVAASEARRKPRRETWHVALSSTRRLKSEPVTIFLPISINFIFLSELALFKVKGSVALRRRLC